MTTKQLSDTVSEYEQQALDFLKRTNTKFSVSFLCYDKHSDDDKESRDVYEVVLQRGSRVFKFSFGQSLVDSGFKLVSSTTCKEFKYVWQEEAMRQAQGDLKKFKIIVKERLGTLDGFKIVSGKSPTSYDVLASLTKYDPGTFENFCGDYAYDADSMKAKKVYDAVVDEWNNIRMLYTDEEISLLQEIQ